MIRIKIAAALLANATLCMGAGAVGAASYGERCKAPVSAEARGQQADPQAPNYGEALARKRARMAWVGKVRSIDGPRFAAIGRARNLSYEDDPGAGQIHVTITATPCR